MLGHLLSRAGVVLLFVAGCSDYPPLPQVVVHPGQSIQAAILRMPPEATTWFVKVKPGVYHETIAVDRAGVTLLGEVTGLGFEDRPIIDGMVEAGRLLQDAVLVTGANFTMQGFTVRNYGGSGVTASKTHDLRLYDLIVDHAGRYGLHPVESEDILIDSCIATGLSVAGIYVGESRRATVRSSLVYSNVTGIEIENTVDALVQGNEAFDNTAGFLAVVLPQSPIKVGQNCTLQGNSAHDNNRANWGDPMALVAKVPAGVGVGVMAADGTVVQDNELSSNRSVGLAIIGLATLFTNPAGVDIEPDPDGTIVRNNSYSGNGKDPDPALKAAGFSAGGDILWDGKGKGNCLDEPDTLAKVGAAGTLPHCM